MTGRAILNCLDDNDMVIHEDCHTEASLYLEDDEHCQMELTLDFPSARIHKKAEFYFWYPYQNDNQIQVTVYESAVKLSEDELLIHFRLLDKNNVDPGKFLGIARLHGEIPADISTGSFFDLSETFKTVTGTEEESLPSNHSVCMRGKIQLNYIYGYPFVLSSGNGKCELHSGPDGKWFMSFPYSFPDLQINDFESIPLNVTDFQAEGYYATWFICIQLSEDELLIGFTIFEDRENYPGTIGGFARFRGKIPTTIQRHVLL